jgi:hypothetical protein
MEAQENDANCECDFCKAGGQFSPLGEEFDWWPALDPDHKKYTKFFTIDRRYEEEIIAWLRTKLPQGPIPMDTTFEFVHDSDTFLGVTRGSTTFVFADGLLETFRKFVNETNQHSGLVFKHWEVDASYVRDILDKPLEVLERINGDQEFYDTVYGVGFWGEPL